MPKAAQKINCLVDTKTVESCLMTKKDAAVKIISGVKHVHSSALGDRDPLALQTQQGLETESVPTYAWEKGKDDPIITVTSSAERHSLMEKVRQSQQGQLHSTQREKFELVFEELLTNAIYHAYRKANGSVKYSRRDNVELTPAEEIAVRYRKFEDGIYLCVTDRGGNFSFNEITRCFQRCYLSSASQIENKEQGAGLGIYMVFESVAHLKIVVQPKISTEISCWIPCKRSCSAEEFSFNFFEVRGSSQGKGKKNG